MHGKGGEGGKGGQKKEKERKGRGGDAAFNSFFDEHKRDLLAKVATLISLHPHTSSA